MPGKDSERRLAAMIDSSEPQPQPLTEGSGGEVVVPVSDGVSQSPLAQFIGRTVQVEFIPVDVPVVTEPVADPKRAELAERFRQLVDERTRSARF